MGGSGSRITHQDKAPTSFPGRQPVALLGLNLTPTSVYSFDLIHEKTEAGRAIVEQLRDQVIASCSEKPADAVPSSDEWDTHAIHIGVWKDRFKEGPPCAVMRVFIDVNTSPLVAVYLKEGLPTGVGPTETIFIDQVWIDYAVLDTSAVNAAKALRATIDKKRHMLMFFVMGAIETAQICAHRMSLMAKISLMSGHHAKIRSSGSGGGGGGDDGDSGDSGGGGGGVVNSAVRNKWKKGGLKASVIAAEAKDLSAEKLVTESAHGGNIANGGNDEAGSPPFPRAASPSREHAPVSSLSRTSAKDTIRYFFAALPEYARVSKLKNVSGQLSPSPPRLIYLPRPYVSLTVFKRTFGGRRGVVGVRVCVRACG